MSDFWGQFLFWVGMVLALYYALPILVYVLVRAGMTAFFRAKRENRTDSSNHSNYEKN